MSFNRRDLLQGTGAVTLAAMLPGQVFAATSADSAAAILLAETAETIFTDYPETAAGLGLDKGKRAALKRRLSDRGPVG